MRVILSHMHITHTFITCSFTLASRERNVFLPDFHVEYILAYTYMHSYLHYSPSCFSVAPVFHFLEYSVEISREYRFYRSRFKRNVISEWKNLLPLVLLLDRYRSIYETNYLSYLRAFFPLFSQVFQ